MTRKRGQWSASTTKRYNLPSSSRLHLQNRQQHPVQANCSRFARLNAVAFRPDCPSFKNSRRYTIQMWIGCSLEKSGALGGCNGRSFSLACLIEAPSVQNRASEMSHCTKSWLDSSISKYQLCQTRQAKIRTKRIKFLILTPCIDVDVPFLCRYPTMAVPR